MFTVYYTEIHCCLLRRVMMIYSICKCIPELIDLVVFNQKARDIPHFWPEKAQAFKFVQFWSVLSKARAFPKSAGYPVLLTARGITLCI
jgi:hypothetical protein